MSRAATVIALVTLLGASFCGPDLTTPADTDVTGTWHSAGPAAGLTNITIVLKQASDGSVTGTFTATGSAPNQTCPAVPPCALSSTVRGANTVLQVNLQLKDAGTFTGQLMTPGSMHGTMTAIESQLTDFDKLPSP